MFGEGTSTPIWVGENIGHDLERWQTGEPIRARPLGQMEKLWRWGRRNPGIAILSAAVILLVVTAGNRLNTGGDPH